MLLGKILLFYNTPLHPIKLGLGNRSREKLIVTSESEVSMGMSTSGQDKRKFKAWGEGKAGMALDLGNKKQVLSNKE